MVFEFDGDEFTFTFKMAISKELNDKFINGKLHDTVTQKAEIIVISKIHNVNNVTIELYDPSEHQFALNSTFEEAVDNLYGLKEVNKETKYINFTTNNQIGDNYLPIKITEAGNYKFTHSNIKFEIYDINKQEVVGDYFKEGLYIIRILNNQSAKSSKINVAYYELNDYDTFENPREILNETINLNLENVYDRQIYSYEVSESGVYQFDSIAATKIKIDIYDSADLSKKINTLTNGKESIILDEGKKYLFVFYCDVHNDLYQDYDINLVYHGDVSTKSISITEEWSDEFLIYRDGKDYKLFFDVDKTGVYVIEVMDSDGDISSCNIGCLKSANGGNQIPEELEDGTNLYYLNSGQNYYYYFNQVNDFYKGKFRYRFIAETTFIEKEVEFANEYITITEVVPTKFSNVKVYFTVGESSYLLLKKGDELPPIYNESHNKVTLIGETYMDEVAGFEVYKYRILEPGNYYFYCTETINMLGSNISFTVKLEPVE